jgi:hypothetical protein
MTSCLSDMRTVCPQGLTFRITQSYWRARMVFKNASGLCNGLNQIFTGYYRVFASRLLSLDGQAWVMGEAAVGLNSRLTTAAGRSRGLCVRPSNEIYKIDRRGFKDAYRSSKA